MDTNKTLLLLLTGFMLRGVFSHAWLNLEGIVPFASRVFGITVTSEVDTTIILINATLAFIFGYFALFHDREKKGTLKSHRAK